MWDQKQIHYFLLNIGFFINNFITLNVWKVVLNSHWFYLNIHSFQSFICYVLHRGLRLSFEFFLFFFFSLFFLLFLQLQSTVSLKQMKQKPQHCTNNVTISILLGFIFVPLKCPCLHSTTMVSHFRKSEFIWQGNVQQFARNVFMGLQWLPCKFSLVWCLVILPCGHENVICQFFNSGFIS